MINLMVIVTHLYASEINTPKTEITSSFSAMYALFTALSALDLSKPQMVPPQHDKLAGRFPPNKVKDTLYPHNRFETKKRAYRLQQPR
jgi:hypothetical protein